MIYKYLKNFLFLVTLLLVTNTLSAQDRVFARTYQSNVLNKGNIDIEIWNTFSFGRANYYTKQKQRLEFEVGITDRLQTAFYLNNSTSTTEYKDSLSGGVKTSSAAISF
ncbi:MAG TPA: hypothetical protein PKM16_09005, partial [Bacteroidia bacterium]|nr:hypothetical protein [Bacteroidia bacterium]